MRIQKPMELTLTVARKRILNFIAMADEYNEWREKTKSILFLDIAPRLEKVRQKGYMGCGFHYGLELDFAKLIQNMAYPWQPSLNHYKNLLTDEFNAMITKIIYKQLIERLQEAERSVFKDEKTN